MAGARTQGAPALLFERLAQPPDRQGASEPSIRMHDAAGVRDSILRQLRLLLNTRVALDIDTLEGRERTTIDYGLPDLSAFPVGNSEAMARLARHIARTISVYEPRLQVQNVVIEALPGRRNALVAGVAGSVKVGLMVEPVSFAIALGEELGETDDG
jgi:type VI secretion system lysozyme-like protein